MVVEAPAPGTPIMSYLVARARRSDRAPLAALLLGTRIYNKGRLRPYLTPNGAAPSGSPATIARYPSRRRSSALPFSCTGPANIFCHAGVSINHCPTTVFPPIGLSGKADQDFRRSLLST